MNVRSLILAVSLAANVALAIALARSLSMSTFKSARPRDAAKASAATSGASASDSATAPLSPDAWRNLATGSLADTVARLKQEGFPPRLMRAIVSTLVAQQFADRHRELAEMARALPWWKTFFGPENQKLIVARQKLSHDQDNVVDALLGPDPGDSEYVAASRRYRYGELPLAKAAALDRLLHDYGEIEADIRAAAQGMLLPEDLEKMRYLRQQQHDDAAGMLTADELFEFDLRSSPTGWWLRTQLNYMNPTPEEFRAIFKVQSAYMKPFADGNAELMTPEMIATLKKEEPRLIEGIKAVLTPERFAEYQLKTDPAYHQTRPLVERLNLPETATAELVAVQKDITKRADAIRADASLDAAARQAQLTALLDEATLKVTNTLGSSGVDAYRRGPGLWLNAIKPSPKS